MKTIVYMCFLGILLFPMQVTSDEVFVYLFRDQSFGKTTWTWCGHPLSVDQFKEKIETVGKASQANNYRLPVRFRPEVSFQEILSVVAILSSAGITNTSLQLVSNPVPVRQGMRKEPILIENFSDEPTLTVPSAIYKSNSGAEKTPVRETEKEGNLVNGTDGL